MLQDRIISQEIADEQRRFMMSVYNWMLTALLITTAVAYFVSTSETMIRIMYGNPMLFMGLFIGELFMVGYLVMAIRRMSAGTATMVFIGYSALNGLTLSFIFLAYTQTTIVSAFFTSAAMFGAMSFYGYTTKKDLTSWGSFFFMGLIGMIIGSIVNIFVASSVLYIDIASSIFPVLRSREYIVCLSLQATYTFPPAITGAVSFFPSGTFHAVVSLSGIVAGVDPLLIGSCLYVAHSAFRFPEAAALIFPYAGPFSISSDPLGGKTTFFPVLSVA